MSYILPPDSPTLSTERRIYLLEKELDLIRGPVRLEHNRALTVNDGHLGDVVVVVGSTRNFIKRAAIGLATLLLCSFGGVVLAIRTHWVEQGRALERKVGEEARIQRLEMAQRLCQCSRVSGPGPADVVTPDP